MEALPLAIAAAALVLARRRRPTVHLAVLALATALAGLFLGQARLAAIDGGALDVRPGGRLAITGTVAAVPRRTRGVVRVRVSTAGRRVLLEAPEPVADLPVGRQVRATGSVSDPPPWYAGYLRRYGIRRVVHARRIELTGARRGGTQGAVDAIRDRAAAAIDRGMPEREASLARGFVLGQDDRIDAGTVEDFKRSGLAHLLAVSGENVLLLALLAMPVLGLIGLPLRARLLTVLALIGLYVLVTGAGPSIQRAGVMGAAGIVATLASRPRTRAYPILLAAFVTLALNPRAVGDPGWQLSFAAVLGIALWAAPLRDLLLRGRRATGLKRALAEGAAVTIAASLATAPLMAHDFDAVPAASLPANLLALPAVAPAMWLGMLSAFLGQLPLLPVEPLNWLNSLLLGYVAAVAHICAAPGWALVPVRLESWASVASAYALVALALYALGRWATRRQRLTGPALPPRIALPIAGAAVLCALLAALPGGGGGRGVIGLRLDFLDVGQGDAILLTPSDGGAVLVDGGPPGDGLRDKLSHEGVKGLAAAIVTHDQSDHAGGIRDAIGKLPISSLVYGDRPPGILRAAAAAGIPAHPIAEGGEVRSGSLRLEVLWPPRDEAPSPGADPNARALVLLARWHKFTALLTADAEAEDVHYDPGPIQVLKIAHHGSADASLPALLERSVPRLAVISVGEHNSYGHPTPETLATLNAHHVPVLRTDRDGTVRIDVDTHGWRVGP